MDFLFGVPGKLNTLLARLSAARAAYLDAAISTRAPAGTALSTLVWTPERAALLDIVSRGKPRKVTILSTQNWTWPDGVEVAIVTLLAGGAAGARGMTQRFGAPTPGRNGGWGGGAGPLLRRLAVARNGVTSTLVTIGAGGVSPLTNPTPETAIALGGDGGATSFGVISVPGGKCAFDINLRNSRAWMLRGERGGAYMSNLVDPDGIVLTDPVRDMQGIACGHYAGGTSVVSGANPLAGGGGGGGFFGPGGNGGNNADGQSAGANTGAGGGGGSGAMGTGDVAYSGGTGGSGRAEIEYWG